jgi:hypothetical protein
MENNNHNPIITDQIANYNFNELQNKITLYKKYLNNQLALNRNLKDKNTSEIKSLLENFINTRSTVVDSQLRELKQLKNELFEVTNENKSLELDNKELEVLIKTPEMNELANKLADIELIQLEINDFLEKNGVIKMHHF